MKKAILAIAALAGVNFNVNAQMTLEHTFTSGTYYVGAVVNLSSSGRKFAVLHDNAIGLYNLDYTLWKTINVPAGYHVINTWSYVKNISEGLFNTDGYVEAAVLNGAQTKWGIINELGNVTDSVDGGYFGFNIYNMGSDL